MKRFLKRMRKRFLWKKKEECDFDENDFELDVMM